MTPNAIVQCTGNKIEAVDFHGKSMFVIQVPESEGEVAHIDARTKYMAVVTTTNCIKMFDITKKPFKQVGITRRFEKKAGVPLGEIKDISLNSDGKKLCILADQ